MDEQIRTPEEQIADLTAERDSLREELEALRTSAAATAAELADTKKLNFTLSRQLDTSRPAKTAEELLNEMF